MFFAVCAVNKEAKSLGIVAYVAMYFEFISEKGVEIPHVCTSVHPLSIIIGIVFCLNLFVLCVFQTGRAARNIILYLHEVS